MAAQRVKAKDYRKAASVLVEAFYDDPVCLYLCHCSYDQQYRKVLQGMMEYIVYAHIMRGIVLQVDDFSGVSLWMGPGNNMDDWYSIVRSGMWRLNYQLDSEGRQRFFREFLPILHDTKAEILQQRDDSSWYLVYVGIKRNSQGKGCLRKLIQPIMDVCSQQNLPIYLESSHPHNRAIYEHFGFALKKTIYLKRDTSQIPLEIMVREADTLLTSDTKPKNSTSNPASISDNVNSTASIPAAYVC
ncbi:N-acetyltransferase [Schizosaccharomyces cryophilus OY26]|uniref:N-acetyltransferase n=1 Tax=Schizosaccharomyces cryophilus (strain OY26 / ATCC MYA-4695 / CBS 11777 / NBRC 106824 / NRRL Y48691) TaxID=653667 RepID=S9VRP2_SCHCR|nr:N-acetyltransferase [Schizosaccharomyces cryophilus OY26]EPY50598.1 N-acetyltransferase [Schizosaccharomyces cryophilus OY26]